VKKKQKYWNDEEHHFFACHVKDGKKLDKILAQHRLDESKLRSLPKSNTACSLIYPFTLDELNRMSLNPHLNPRIKRSQHPFVEQSWGSHGAPGTSIIDTFESDRSHSNLYIWSQLSDLIPILNVKQADLQKSCP